MTKLPVLLIVLLLSTSSFAATLAPAEEGTPSKDNRIPPVVEETTSATTSSVDDDISPVDGSSHKGLFLLDNDDNRIPPVEETASPDKATTSSVDDGISPGDDSSHKGLFLLDKDVLDKIVSRLTTLQKKSLEVAMKCAKLTYTYSVYTYTEKEEKEISDVQDVLPKLREIDTNKKFATHKEFAARLESYLGEFIALEHVQVAMKKTAKDMKRDKLFTKYNKNEQLALHVEKQLAEFILDPSKFEQAVKDAKRQTWLMKAVVKNNVDAVQAVLLFPPSNLKSEIGTLLNAASSQDRLTLLKELWESVAVLGILPVEAFLSALKGALSCFDRKRKSECLRFVMRFKQLDKDSIEFAFQNIQPGCIRMWHDRDKELVASVNHYLGVYYFYKLDYKEGIFRCIKNADYRRRRGRRQQANYPYFHDAYYLNIRTDCAHTPPY